jgi:hypothetical protein
LSRADAYTLVLPRLRPYQDEVFDLCLAAWQPHGSREFLEAALVSATQIGKTRLGAKLALALAFCFPGSLTWWAAPTMGQTLPGFREIGQMGGERRVIWRTKETASTTPPHHILVNGSKIEYRSWDREDTIGGPAVHQMFFDESHELSPTANPKLRARRSGTLGPMFYMGNADYLSSVFWRICVKAEAGDGSTLFRRWTWRTRLEGLAGAARHEYENAMARELETQGKDEFERLYEAKFLTLGTGVLNFAGVATNGGDMLHPVTLPYFEPWDGEHACVAGLDLGDQQDFSVLSIVDDETGRLIALDRFNHMGWEAQVARIVEVAKRYCRRPNREKRDPGQELAIYVDATMLGAPVYQMLDKASADLPIELFPVTFDNAKKRQMVQYLQAATQGGWISMPWIQEAIDEAQMLERKPLASGVTYSASGGSHDDIVWSLGLMGWGRMHQIRVAA